ncbi:MAG: hypothetical protein EOO46_01040 [Flavobacterium sp.]|nr:MAG: hypothetical protein EOO46_01040 [Flavobacterium sp.]
MGQPISSRTPYWIRKSGGRELLVMMLDVPILFLVFNRPEATAKVFAQIKKVRPQRLYLAADGPRFGQPSEEIVCRQVRELVINRIDWDCEIKTLFREENLGCKTAVSSALKWFFQQEEMGIILEDDCLPDESFFTFCQEMLIRYQNNTKIISIAGSNLGYQTSGSTSYGFSRILNVWGWATWRRSAELVDYELLDWKYKRYKDLFLLSRTKQYRGYDMNWIRMLRNYFDLTASRQIDTWDYQWIYTQMQEKTLAVFPANNLVKNIGFNENATHTVNPNHPIAKLALESIQFPLQHPHYISADFDYEEYQKNIWFENKSQTLWKALKTKLLYVQCINWMNSKFKERL